MTVNYSCRRSDSTIMWSRKLKVRDDDHGVRGGNLGWVALLGPLDGGLGLGVPI